MTNSTDDSEPLTTSEADDAAVLLNRLREMFPKYSEKQLMDLLAKMYLVSDEEVLGPSY